eukprot:CAMPEP_0113543644 /NCGR_PEP_ID=MMETSP0015_2-20120614/10269_1 /TAXON_ID=2838 /ORGANISM="Odontella" /LENGTH=76 /DNA_ID=CAMNT_0000443819 /DNA_START=578 /DNA_END=808 /DNA_ORIENTATION=+ /assembly_acc=CAM_ASM_000160
MKFRAERNFWLSLFNVILWMLVWVIHHDRMQILKLKDRLSELEATATADGSEKETPADKATSEEVKEKSDEAKKAD